MSIKDLFPYSQTGIHYLDSAASTQKPASVLEGLRSFYTTEYGNVHRGLHRLAERATIRYEQARRIIAGHIDAKPDRVSITSGTTDAMNLLAGYPLSEDDTVFVAIHDHHSTFVPFQRAAGKAGADFHVIPLAKDQTLDYDAAERMIEKHGCTVLATLHLSNVTGELVDVERLARAVHKKGGMIFVDGAQAIPHLDVDVEALGVDAYAFSGHKCYGPTGVGALYMTEALADSIPPSRVGGEMVDEVGLDGTTFKKPPYRYEAGTPPIAQTVGMGAALEFLQGVKGQWEKEQELVDSCYDRLDSLGFIDIIGSKERKALVSFTVEGVHAHDVAQFLDTRDVAVRAGHHCTEPLHTSLGIAASVRASFGLYSIEEDIDALIDALKECKEAFDV